MVRLIPLAIFAGLFSIVNILTMIYARPYILIVLSITLAFHKIAIFFTFTDERAEGVHETQSTPIKSTHAKNE